MGWVNTPVCFFLGFSWRIWRFRRSFSVDKNKRAPIMEPMPTTPKTPREPRPDAIHFSVEWKMNWGYHVYAHCPTCGSSFASEGGRDLWHKDAKAALLAAANGLSEHMVAYHAPKTRSRHLERAY